MLAGAADRLGEWPINDGRAAAGRRGRAAGHVTAWTLWLLRYLCMRELVSFAAKLAARVPPVMQID